MAFNGSGVFNRLYNWVNDAAANIKIRADRMDAEFNGIATGLTNCITKDGQTTVTANLPMVGFKHTGVGNASSSDEYAAYGQLTTAISSINNLGDVVITSATSGDYLKYDGTNWINTPISLDVITATGADGVLIKNSGGTTVATIGASNTTASTFAGNTTVQGLLAVQGITYATGRIEVAGNSTAAGYIKLFEDTDNGTNSVTITPPQSIASDYTLTLPSSSGTLALGLSVSAPVASTSGTYIDFLSIPSTAKRIHINFMAVSTSGTSNWILQLGDSGGIETTGYVSSGSRPNVSSTTSTSGIILCASPVAAQNATGRVTIEIIDEAAFQWSAAGFLTLNGSNGFTSGAGYKSLSAALDMVRVTTEGGTDTFDNGTINISYEY